MNEQCLKKSMDHSPQMVSVIVTTYNNRDKLRCVLHALNAQVESRFEVIVVDDGSRRDTREMVEHFQSIANYPLRLIWQPDWGFRAARCRNLGLRVASGDYIVFLDGDCVPQSRFIQQHIALAQLGFFVSGNRVLLSARLSHSVESGSSNIYNRNALFWFVQFIKRSSNKLCPLLSLFDGNWRKKKANTWQGVKTCNLGAWRSDLFKINGFDEAFNGWGYEDSDLVVRLLNLGVKRKLGKYATEVFHLWHAEEDRGRESSNRVLLKRVIKNQSIQPAKSLIRDAVSIPANVLNFEYLD